MSRMSDLDGAYGQSSLATLNPAYNQPRIQSMAQLPGTRRPSRGSYKPANPPPSIALPATPSFSTKHSSSLQHPHQSLKPANHPPTAAQRGPSPITHPYSAQSLASTPDLEHQISDEQYNSTDFAHRAHYHSYANNNGADMAIPSQPAAFAGDARQASSSAVHVLSHPAGPPSPALSWDRSPVVSPGSYFAAYPPTTGVASRERSGSANSTSSVEMLPQAAPMSYHQAQSSKAPSHRTSPSMASSVPASESSSRGKRASSSRSHPHKSRPSTRKALTTALELAKVAVQLDGTSEDPHGAVKAYARSVRLLREVMERVMRGEDSPSTSSSTRAGEADDQKPIGRRRSVVAKEEEVRRLKAIHDTYADRMKILCLIYSIPDPLSNATQDQSSTTPEEPTPSPSRSVPTPSSPLQVESTATLVPPLIHPVPNAPDDIETDEGSEVDLDAVTIRRHQAQATPTPESEGEADSEVEQRWLSRDRLRANDRELEGTLLAYNLPSPQEDTRPEDSATFLGNGTSQTHTAGTSPARVAADDTPLASSGPPVPGTVHVTVGGRTSILPPPRPPPTGPLPTRPRLPSGGAVPPQLLNQPLPPLPPQQPSEPASQPIHSQQPTLTRQSSASSVSAVSDVSSVASGSSAASNVYTPAPASQIGTASLATPNTFGGRPRGNSNAHARTQSNAERLVVVNEEREEEETAPSTPAKDAPPASLPQEYRYRSRSSSMVSLKDRDRAKAQVLGVNGLVPPVPALSPSSSPSATPTVPANHVAPKALTLDQSSAINPSASSPDLTTFGQRVTPRARGSSIGSAATQSTEDFGSTTAPVPAIPYTAGAPPPLSGPIIIPGALGSDTETSVKISPNPNSGTISQRRIKNATTGSTPPPAPSSGSSSALGKLTSAILPAATATSLGLVGRNRAASNPGKWPNGMFNVGASEATSRAAGPAPPMSAGGKRQFPGNGRFQSFGVPGSANASTTSLITGGSGTGTPTPSVAVAGLPASSLPPSPPNLSILRPYFLIALLRRSMIDRSGGYVTPRLHIPHEVWTQGSAKLTNMPEKVKVIDVLNSALEDLANASIDFCGVSSGIAASTGGADGNKKQAERWASKLEEFDRTFGQLAETFGKKLGVGSGFVVKKSAGMAAWGNKFLDKISTAGKQYDSPIAHSNLLTRFFTQVQLLDEHTRALRISPQPPCYSSLPQDIRSRIDVALGDISELFTKVVLTFVFHDLNVMLDKYHKTCDRWIQSNPGNPP